MGVKHKIKRISGIFCTNFQQARPIMSKTKIISLVPLMDQHTLANFLAPPAHPQMGLINFDPEKKESWRTGVLKTNRPHPFYELCHCDGQPISIRRPHLPDGAFVFSMAVKALYFQLLVNEASVITKVTGDFPLTNVSPRVSQIDRTVQLVGLDKESKRFEVVDGVTVEETPVWHARSIEDYAVCLNFQLEARFDHYTGDLEVNAGEVLEPTIYAADARPTRATWFNGLYPDRAIKIVGFDIDAKLNVPYYPPYHLPVLA